VFYPIIVWIISRLAKKPKTTENYEPKISVIISAYNEKKVIEQRIKNLLEQDYDLNKIEIIVGSDNSSDGTNEILLRLQNEIPQLKVFIFNYRQGKAGVINQLVNKANNDILVFTDANTEFKKDAIKKLVRHFLNEEIGGVSGKLVLVDRKLNQRAAVEEKDYWEFETLIKTSEGRLGILIGANGGIFTIRKNLFEKIPIEKAVTDDFFISLNVIKKGFKLIYEPEAQAFEEISSDFQTEFKRKVRFAATNFQTISFFKSLLLNKNLILSYAFWSHKIIRWFLPVILIFILILNIYLFNQSKVLEYFFYFQILIYLSALLGYLLLKYKIRIPLLSLLTYFFLTNFALLQGFIRFLRKKHSVIWESTPR
jgi:cellulose synthase/poly-beta-1,6-N-acetylglucosamine synthase-like glycosyltransferase